MVLLKYSESYYEMFDKDQGMPRSLGMGCYEMAMDKYLTFKEENHFIELILMVFHELYSFFLFLKAHSASPLSPEFFLFCFIPESTV